jgi:hypothetical protein
VALLKKHGDAAAIAGGALAYGEVKAEYDGIIAGLIVALARKDERSAAMQVRVEGTLFASGS